MIAQDSLEKTLSRNTFFTGKNRYRNRRQAKLRQPGRAKA
ncbi:MAG: hypothetical protein GX489_02240 [Firmicutes bacterium]|nr:hypothetical protein [Bacillota bacterium]